MPDSNGHPGRTVGRRDSDGTLRINPKAWGAWIALAAGAIALATYGVQYVGSKIVTPPEIAKVHLQLDSVRNGQERTRAANQLLQVRIDSMGRRMLEFQDMAEVIVIDICLRRRNDPYALRKLNCERYLP